ncbi:hypothetical protein SNE40_011036 [Patella caerulea]|uniref:Potassium channel subfamily K member 1 n=1 Tax=Patella caerulea TaxID=87958 RepID=A0AAN8PTE3_PATCE
MDENTNCICGSTSKSVRLLFLVIFMIGYLCFGALIFAILEQPVENKLVNNLRQKRVDLLQTHQCITDDDLEEFIKEVVSAANRGVSAVNNVTMTDANWSFGQALFFAATVLTTIGYGRVTPLSDGGKGFCILYAIIGIPLTLILFTALVERLMVPAKLFLLFLYRKLGHLYKIFHIQLMHLFITLALFMVLFLLVPAAIFTVLEPKWNYLDAFYYCFISLTTIGLGDYIPGDSAQQQYRAIYKLSTTAYLLLGLVMLMSVLAVVYEIPELNLGFHFYMKSDGEDEEQVNLKSSMDQTGTKYTKHKDEDIEGESSYQDQTVPPGRPVDDK